MPRNPAPEEALSIGRTAKEAGLSTEALRIWERRYGVPKPIRRESGHRRYTPEQVAWLKSVRRALDRGHRPGHVLRLSEAELAELLHETVIEEQTEARIAPHIQQLMVHLVEQDVAAFARDLAADSRARGPYSFATDTVMPLVEELGARREDGRMSTAAEQRARALLADVLMTYQQRLPVAGDGPRVLGTTLDGVRQGFPMQLGVMLTRAMGVYAEIGPDVSTGLVPEIVRRGRFDIIGARIEESPRAYERARDLRDTIDDPYVVIVVGGAGTLDVPTWPDGVEVCNGVDEWLQWLQAYLARR